MRKIFTPQWLSLLLFIFLFSCKVEKRHYTKGYYISWNKSKSAKNPVEKEKPTKTEETAVVLNKEKPFFKAKEHVNSETNNGSTLEASVIKKGLIKKSSATRQNVHTQLLKLKALNFKPLKFLPDGPQEPDEDDAMIALIVSIAGFFVLGFIGSIVGLVLANRALRKIKAQPDKYGGEDLASTARVISIIGIILGIIALIAVIAFIAIVASIAI